LIKKELKE